MIPSSKKVISVVAVRTGCGKSQTTRRIIEICKESGKRVVAIRHPMPYGDLGKQIVQRFEKIEDLEKNNCTIEEMEEYEPHISSGGIIYSGVDYKKILAEAEKESDIIVWDGGNNDTSFYKSDLTIVVVDPLRAGHEISYYPGEINLRIADVIVINKIDSATKEQIALVDTNITNLNPHASRIYAESVLSVDNIENIKGKNVLVIEDGPTLTHGGMLLGAGIVAAQRYNAKNIVDPRIYAIGAIKSVFEKYPHIGTLLPAMGYGKKQMRDLERTIQAIPCDSIVIATPIDLSRFIHIEKPVSKVRYDLSESGKEKLKKCLQESGMI